VRAARSSSSSEGDADLFGELQYLFGTCLRIERRQIANSSRTELKTSVKRSSTSQRDYCSMNVLANGEIATIAAASSASAAAP
jgi:hypothetical protein